MSRSWLADVLPLTPPQEGLLHHALDNGQAVDIQTAQLVVSVTGRPDLEWLQAAWRGLLSRQDNVRPAFRREGSNRPVHLVPHEVTVPVSEVDLTGRGAAAVAALAGRGRRGRALALAGRGAPVLSLTATYAVVLLAPQRPAAAARDPWCGWPTSTREPTLPPTYSADGRLPIETVPRRKRWTPASQTR